MRRTDFEHVLYAPSSLFSSSAISLSLFTFLVISSRQPAMANDPGPSEWSLRDLAFYLNHAQAGLGKIEQTRGRPSVLTGACAIWLYAYDPQHYADNHPPEDEVTKIIDELRFPRNYIVS